MMRCMNMPGSVTKAHIPIHPYRKVRQADAQTNRLTVMPPMLIPLVQHLPAAFRQRLPWLTRAFVALLVCWLLGWLALPLALKPQLEQRASEA